MAPGQFLRLAGMELASLSSVLRGQGFMVGDLGCLPSVQAIQVGKFYPKVHGANKQIDNVRDKRMKKKKKWEERE